MLYVDICSIIISETFSLDHCSEACHDEPFSMSYKSTVGMVH